MEKADFEEEEGLKEILEEAEILAELKEEEKIRKKNTKIVTLAAVGLLVCGVVFYWAQPPPSPVEQRSGNEAPPPKDSELFPEVGKIKESDQSVKEMDFVREPLVSDEDSLPAQPPRVVEAVTPPLKSVERVKKKAVEPVKRKAKAKHRTYRIRVGTFVLAGELKQALEKVKALGLVPSTKKEKNKINMHKVLVGPYSTKNKALSIQNRLKGKNMKGFITRAEGNYFVHVGAFYKRDGARRMREKVDKLGYPSKSLYQLTDLLCNTVYAVYKGTRSEAEKNRDLLIKKGFERAEIVS